MLHGRGEEQAQLAAMLAGAKEGTAAALIVRGEPGVGKSTLLDSVAADAADYGMRVLRTLGLESEAPLAFAGLHQLLAPLLSQLDRLPTPQARALRVAFGQEEGEAADRFVIALATLGLLTDAAETQPVVVIVDDAHWLDDASADALLFATRRLQADPVVVLLGVRDGDSRTLIADDLPSMTLAGLDDAASRSLLAERLGRPLPEELTLALLAQTGGNPLALVELPAALSDEQLHGVAPLPDHLRLTERVQRVFLDRCRRLPQPVQTVLLVAAADDTSSLRVVREAAARLGVPPPDAEEALRQAEEARLLDIERDVVRVRHPLVRSAVYHAATGQERRKAHEALAAALGRGQYSDRQAWHLASAADGPDQAASDGLAGVAERAERAGGYAAAAAGYERAAELDTTEAGRAERLYLAARNAWAAGEATRGRRLADEAKAIADERVLRADIDRLRARIEINVGSAATGHHILTTAARAVAADDPVRALEMRVAATLTHQFNDDVPEEVEEWSDAVLPTDPRTRCLGALLSTTTADAQGRWVDALAALSETVRVSAEVDDLDVVANVGNAALHLGDDEAQRRCYGRVLGAARDRGAVMAVLYALPRLAFADYAGGQWDRLRDGSNEAVGLAAATGQPALAATSVAWLTILAAVRGDDTYEGLRVQLDEVERGNLGVVAAPVHDLSRWAAAVRALAVGEAATALHELGKLHVHPLMRMAALDRFEAAARAGDPNLAEAWVTDLEAFASATGWPWAHASVAYGRALLAQPAEAAEWFETALEHHSRANRPYERARTHLAYGELLRRNQRRVDARPHLRAALALFEDLGAAPLVTRAAHELRASGETARKRDPSTLTALTPMELQVVQLVAQGLSNKDVAAKLWISPRTVAFHLRGAFAKLQVSSRAELTQLQLAQGAPSDTSDAAVAGGSS